MFKQICFDHTSVRTTIRRIFFTNFSYLFDHTQHLTGDVELFVSSDIHLSFSDNLERTHFNLFSVTWIFALTWSDGSALVQWNSHHITGVCNIIVNSQNRVFTKWENEKKWLSQISFYSSRPFVLQVIPIDYSRLVIEVILLTSSQP